MSDRNKMTGKAVSMPKGLLISSAISTMLTVGAALLLAKLVETGSFPWENIGYGVMAVLLISSYAGAKLACGLVKRRNILVSFLSGALYFGILLCITALFFGGQYEAVGVTALLVVGGSVCAALINTNKRNISTGRKKRIHG